MNIKTQLTMEAASSELAALKALNDGKEYCMTMDPFAKGSKKWRVGEKTDTQKRVDASNPMASTRVVDFLANHDIASDLH